MPLSPRRIVKWTVRIAAICAVLCVVAVVVLAIAGSASIVKWHVLQQRMLDELRSDWHPERHTELTELDLSSTDFGARGTRGVEMRKPGVPPGPSKRTRRCVVNPEIFLR
jgi:hypothetical protein